MDRDSRSSHLGSQNPQCLHILLRSEWRSHGSGQFHKPGKLRPPVSPPGVVPKQIHGNTGNTSCCICFRQPHVGAVVLIGRIVHSHWQTQPINPRGVGFVPIRLESCPYCCGSRIALRVCVISVNGEVLGFFYQGSQSVHFLVCFQKCPIGWAQIERLQWYEDPR